MSVLSLHIESTDSMIFHCVVDINFRHIYHSLYCFVKIAVMDSKILGLMLQNLVGISGRHGTIILIDLYQPLLK